MIAQMILGACCRCFILRNKKGVLLFIVSLFPLILVGNEIDQGGSGGAKKALLLDRSLPVLLDYSMPAMNKDKDEEERITLLLKDGISKKSVFIQLKESGKNSGNFEGSFSISWSESGAVSPEVYLPPQKILSQSAGKDKVSKMVQEGALLRKPYFLRKDQTGRQRLSVFNAKKDAMAAFNQFKAGVGKAVQVAAKASGTGSSAAKVPALTAAEELALEQARLKKLAIAQEELRLRLEAEEKEKQEARLLAEKRLSEEERRQRLAKAKELAAKALGFYQAENFVQAEVLFQESLTLDPSNRSYYFQYGVSLYRNDKFNEALVALNLAQGEGVNNLEREYFKALSLMKLNDYDEALKYFLSIKNQNDAQMSPAASFFAGIIYFSKEDWKSSRSQFEYTLDNSQDPKMDEQAEMYIEQIIAMEQLESKRKNPFTLDVTAGLSYDSNVLLVSDSSSSSASATDKAGLRGLLVLGLDYRLLFTDKNEVTLDFGYIDMYTVNSSLKPEATLQNSDPQMISFKVPWKIKTNLYQKPYQVTFALGLETLNLNADASGARELILSSNLLSIEQVYFAKEDYMATLNFEFRQDDSKLSGDSGVNSDATKISLSHASTWFLDAKKQRAYLGGLGLSSNNAKGDNEKFTKVDLSFGYLTPFYYETNFVSQLALSSSQYPSHTEKRADTNTALNLAFSKSLAERLTGSLALNYTLNASNVEASSYNKYSLTFVTSWGVDF